MGAPATLEEVRHADEADLYPQHALKGCTSALALFCAAFYGRQDCVWLAVAGLHATCIDVDADRLDEMADLYPTDWDFLEADVYEWAPAQERHWDVVSVDCPSGHFDRCAALLPLWCRIARRVVVLGCGLRHDDLVAPAGWSVTEVLKRSAYDGGVFWAVLEPIRESGLTRLAKETP